MNNKPKSLNLIIKNFDIKKSKSNISYKQNILPNKITKNNDYILSLKKSINPLFANSKKKNQDESIKPRINNLLSNYLFSNNKKTIYSPFNNEAKNHISLGDLINNKSECPLKIKQKLKNIYSNKSESKLNVITNSKMMPLNTFKNGNTINQSNLSPNYSERLFPILNTQSKKSSNNILENELNINSTGNLHTKKKSIRFNLIGNNIIENNKQKTNIFFNINNISSSKNEPPQSPTSVMLNSTKYSNNNNNTNVSRKQMIKIFSDSKIKKNKINAKKLSLKLISPLCVDSDNNNIFNKEMINKNKTPEYTLHANKKKILINNKNLEKNKISQETLKSNISEKFKNKIISFKNNHNNKNQKSLINQLNIFLMTDRSNDKEKLIRTKKEYNFKDIINIKKDKNAILDEFERKDKKNSNLINYGTGISNDMNNNDNNNNVSKMSSSQSSFYDFNYYMKESNKLSEFIKSFYKKNKRYPDSKIDYYKIGRKIGQGAFGKVNIGLHILTGRVVAIKSFKKDNCSNERIDKIINERNIMKELNNKNIIKIFDYFEDNTYIFIIMEYINGGNLYSLIKKRRVLQEKVAKFIFKQMISALKYIHSHNIVHRDIKLDNILLDLHSGIKICDFGIGKKLNSPNKLLKSFSGTPIYMAPEIILCEKNNGYRGFPVDVWSSGVALYIMLSGKLPFKNSKNKDNQNKENKNKELEYSIINKEPNEIKNISDTAKDLIKGLLCKNPAKRITCDEILNHPWLKNEDFNNEHMLSRLFAKNEIIMLSKTYIDYRKDKNENLKEYFNMSNLYEDSNSVNEDLKNEQSKSRLLTPFNTMITSESPNNNSIRKGNSLESSFNQKIQIENDVLVIGNKVKEHYRLYELNNNNEIDNGIMIYTQLNSNNMHSSTQSKDNNIIQINSNGFKKYNSKNKSLDNIQKEKILNQLEIFGYNRDYVLKSLKNNELNYATASYFIMKYYDNLN